MVQADGRDCSSAVRADQAPTLVATTQGARLIETCRPMGTDARHRTASCMARLVRRDMPPRTTAGSSRPRERFWQGYVRMTASPERGRIHAAIPSSLTAFAPFLV